MTSLTGLTAIAMAYGLDVEASLKIAEDAIETTSNEREAILGVAQRATSAVATLYGTS